MPTPAHELAPIPTETAARDRASRLLLGALCALWVAVAMPLALGTETFFARDVFTTHLHAKAFGARELTEGRIPYFRTDFGLGETFRGDPNYLPLYPGNLLYLALPFWSAFNLHYALHWLLALFTMRRLARALGLSREAALLAGMTYAGCGYGLTCLGFYNLIAVLAWWPLALAGVVATDRRALAVGGLACGLALYGGEPISTALGMVTLVLLAFACHGARRALQRSAVVVALGVLLALPQIVATARVLGFSGRGNLAADTESYAFHPARLLELLIPLPFGNPFELGPGAFLSGKLAATTPFVYSLHFGVVGLLLALVALRARRERWVAAASVLAAAGVLLAWLGGPLAGALATLSAGLFRYPEKLLLWPALAVPLLAARGLDAAARADGTLRRAAIALASLSGMLALAAASPALDAALRALGASPDRIGELRNPAIVGAVLSTLLIATVALVPRLPTAHRGIALLVLQLLCLLRLAPLVATDDARFYREPAPWSARVPRGAAVVAGGFEDALGLPRPTYYSTEASRRLMTQIGHLDLDFPTGTLAGYKYPLVHAAAGLGSPLLRVLRQSLPSLDWQKRVGWLRMLGVEYLTLPLPPDRSAAARLTAGLEPLDVAVHAGVPTMLARVSNSPPEAWWPERVEVSTDTRQILADVGNAESPTDVAWTPAAVAHRSGARVTIVQERRGTLEVIVDGPGGLLVLRRSFHPLLRVTAGGRRLQTVPVNLVLYGVLVPPGQVSVRLEVPALSDRLALFGPLCMLGAGLVLVTRQRRATDTDAS